MKRLETLESILERLRMSIKKTDSKIQNREKKW